METNSRNRGKNGKADLLYAICLLMLAFVCWSGQRRSMAGEESGNAVLAGTALREAASAERETAAEQVRAAESAAAGTKTAEKPLYRKSIALTFDDGPDPRYTPKLLDGLAERGAKASFFLTGENAENYPELVERMQKEGHLIGNHTYSHLQLTGNNREQFRDELVRTNGIIKEITGEEVVYVRPPYGSWDKSFEEELNMFPVLWNIDPLDWCTDNASNIVKRVLSRAKEDAIILMHDEYPSTVTAALQIVDALQGEGYTFVTVEEILFD